MTALYLGLQRCAPQHLISRIAGWLADRRHPWIKHPFIQCFMAAYGISLDEAERRNYKEYVDFNDFFTRTLQENARPLHTGPGRLISPVDGSVNTFGQLEGATLLQAKGHPFNLDTLLTDAQLTKRFAGGSYMSLYLAPHNYHRVHLPLDGQLTRMIHVPGKLFAVNPTTMHNLPNVIARNERMISIWETAHGPMAVIMVGAMIVGSIRTTWAGQLQGRQIKQWSYDDAPVQGSAGDDIGQFRLGGSMVVVLLGPQASSQHHWTWETALHAGQAVQMGQHIGSLTDA